MITAQQTTLLDAITAFLHGERFRAPQSIPWEELFQESVAQAVGLIAWQGLQTDCVPKAVKTKWQAHALQSLHANMTVHASHAAVHTLLNGEQIPYVILKGSVSASYYPDPAMRAMGDVDFLVSKRDVKRTQALLEREGFIKIEDKHLCHIAYARGEERAELHFAPVGMPEGRLGKILDGYFADIYEKSTVQSILEGGMSCPSDFHHGLTLLMHTYHHLLSEGIGLRHLTDLAVFITHVGEGFSELFEQKLRAVGLWRFAQILSTVCVRYLKIPYHSWMGELNEELCEKVLCDIFDGGNFGVKDGNRAAQGVVISDRGKGGVKRGKLSQAFHTVNEAGKTRYPRLAKIPLLRHLCFIPMGVRQTFLVMTGRRRRVKLLGEWKRAEARRQIYKQFELFEIGDNHAN